MVLWLFWAYSFIGYLLEKAFAAVTQSPRQGRRCCLLLPLCPVYGLGVLAVLALPAGLTDSFWGLAVWGGLAATAVEYGVHLLYETLLGVRFWDYSGLPGAVEGRVCLPFTLAWGLLLAAGLPPVQVRLLPLLAAIPPGATWAMLMVSAADAMLSARVLRRTRDPEAVRPRLL